MFKINDLRTIFTNIRLQYGDINLFFSQKRTNLFTVYFKVDTFYSPYFLKSVHKTIKRLSYLIYNTHFTCIIFKKLKLISIIIYCYIIIGS